MKQNTRKAYISGIFRDDNAEVVWLNYRARKCKFYWDIKFTDVPRLCIRKSAKMCKSQNSILSRTGFMCDGQRFNTKECA